MERIDVMDRRDELRLDDFVRKGAASDMEQVSDETYQKLCELLPHKMFAYLTLDVERAQIVSLVNNGFPGEYLDQARISRSRLIYDLVGRWLQVMRPLYFNRHSLPLDGYLLNGRSALGRASPFQHIEMHNIALHGKVDAGRGLASCFIFGNLEDPDGRQTKLILHSVAPQLHELVMPCSNVEPDPPDSPDPLAPSLSTRERHVLSLLADGRTDAAIGARLQISVCTVRIHVRNILRKLNATNRTHAVVKALRSRLLKLSVTVLVHGPAFALFESLSMSNGVFL
jgi:DNA-binding CsgD family transcriptional regulator